MKLANLKTQELEKHKDKWLIIPFGSIEQHGQRLPLSVDVDIAKSISLEIAERCNHLVAPPVIYSTRSLPNSGGGDSFMGNIHLSVNTFMVLTKELIQSYKKNGFSKILILNGHYENLAFIFEAIEQLKEDRQLNGIKIMALNWWDVLPDSFISIVTNGKFVNWSLEHAGMVETSIQMVINPDTVDVEESVENKGIENSFYSYPIMQKNLSKTGSLSSSSGATKEMGKEIIDFVCNQIMNLIDDMEGNNEFG